MKSTIDQNEKVQESQSHGRIELFGGSLDDFTTKESSPAEHIDSEEIDRIARENNFTSRTGQKEGGIRKARRQFLTGRNRQINIKATDGTVEKLYFIADHCNIPLGEVLERALKSLEDDMITSGQLVPTENRLSKEK